MRYWLMLVLLLAPGLVGCIWDDDDPWLRSDWAYEVTELDALNARGLRGDGVRVCIVDTGIDAEHPALAEMQLVGWRDFINDRPEPYDDHGHGTAMVSILVARAPLGGMVPRAELMVAKGLDANGSSDGGLLDSVVADAIDWCVNRGSHVITLSLAGQSVPLVGSSTERAARAAIDEGVFVVAGVGNDGEDDDGDVAAPASERQVIGVGAIDSDLRIAPFSSRGDNDGFLAGVDNPPDNDRQDPDRKPELVAPGVEITVAYTNNRYLVASGTSASTVFVSGAVVLLLEAHPEYQRNSTAGGPDAVAHFKQLFMDTARPLAQETPHDDHYGYGLLQAEAAL